MKKLIVALLAGAMLMMATSAMATKFNFEYSGAFKGSGQLDANHIVGNEYAAVSGFTDIVGLGLFTLTGNPNAPGTATSPSGLFYFDNNVFTTPPLLNNLGLLFSQGNVEFNIFDNGDGANGIYAAYIGANGGYPSSGNVAFNAAPVPEPGTMMLLGAGLFGLAIFGKRRMNKEA